MQINSKCMKVNFVTKIKHLQLVKLNMQVTSIYFWLNELNVYGYI